MIRTIAPRLLGILLFAVILARIDFAQAAGMVAAVSGWGVAGSLAAALVLASLRAQRWRALLASVGVTVGRRHALDVTARSMLWGAITPARLGELIRIHDLVHRHGLPAGKATGLWVVDMGLDVAGALFATALLALVDPEVLAGLVSRPVAAGLLAGGCLAMLLAPRLAARLSRWVRCVEVLNSGFAAVAVIPATTLAALAALSMVSFAAYATSVAALTSGMAFLSAAQVAALSGLASLVNIVPVTVLGLGTRDVTFIAVFARWGWPPEAAVGLSLLTLLAALLAVVAYWALSAGLRSRK